MIQRFRTIILGFIFLFPLSLSAASNDADMMNSVVKVLAYERNSLNGSYTALHYGSAVMIDSTHIVTNAHVVLDTEGNDPTGYYEVCRNEKNKKTPTCYTTAKLLHYDKIVDLAYLELATSSPTGSKVTFSTEKNLSIGTSVIVYGYPGIGGISVTRTEGKIGGYENDNYKFDGTIDRGNSGGGAFSSDGKLIGIPYAIKSDNGLIGYIIPTTILTKFLAKKTDNIEFSTEKTESDFAPYIKSIESFYKTPNLIKSKYLEIKNAEKNGFKLQDAATSIDGSVFSLKFLDKTSRVYFSVSCSKDAQSTWKNSFEYLHAIYLANTANKDFPNKVIESTDPSGQIYTLTYTDKKETKGEKGEIKSFYFKNAPTCAVTLLANDPSKKDKTSYEKAITLIKTIKFSNPLSYTSDFSSPYFTLKSLPKNIIVTEEIPSISSNELTPGIGVLLESQNLYVIPTIHYTEFDNLGSIMEYASSSDETFDGTYSFDDFYKEYKTVGYRNITDSVITSKNGKKLVMSIADYSDTDKFPVKYEKYVTFFYPFKTNDGKYYGMKIQFKLTTNDEKAIFTIKELVESMELPGVSPFTK